MSGAFAHTGTFPLLEMVSIRLHDLSIECMARRDALVAHHGQAVSNPYPVCHADHAVWQAAFNSEALRLAHADLALEAA